MSHQPTVARRLTVPEFGALKGKRRISMLTAYDYPMAELLDECGLDGILVGDSLSMVVQGRRNTLPVTLDEMIYHAEMVGRAVRHALVVVDLPFPSCQLGVYKAVESASQIVKRTDCQAVKLEGGAEQAEVITGLVGAGIPVMAHVGLRPQSVHQLGGYKVQRDRDRLIADADAAAEAGAFAVLLECIPEGLASEITQRLPIPTIGIGAGAQCDGQILVLQDLLGLTAGRLPKHVKPFADLREAIRTAVSAYQGEVRTGTFPAREQSFQ